MKKRGWFWKTVVIIVLLAPALTVVSEIRDRKDDATASSSDRNKSTGRVEEKTDSRAADTPSDDGITPELKEFLEAYENCMDEYCEFMENYDASNLKMLEKYNDFMQKFIVFSDKAQKYDPEEMTDADSIYYLETMNRIEIKMLKTVQNMQ